ncbi:MAG: hypothetical protein DRQ89_14760, partial [Epsilonproteobacteria bacterium]
KKYIGMFIIAAVCGSSIADVVTTGTFTAPGDGAIGDTSDAFQNATVTGGTATHSVFLKEDAFTAGSPIVSRDVIFGDLVGEWLPAIEFSLASAIQLGELKMIVAIDGNDPNRGSSSIRVYASNTPGVFTPQGVGLIAQVDYSADFNTVVGEPTMQVSIDFTTAPLAQYYRVEFVAARADRGPRVIEIDGYEAIPEPATLGLVALFGGGVLWIRRTFAI